MPDYYLDADGRVRPRPPIRFTAPCPHGHDVDWLHHRPEDPPIPGCYEHPAPVTPETAAT